MTDSKKADKRCFVICPIGDSGSEIRVRSNDIFENLIRPIAEAAGYAAHRVIDNDRPGDITYKVIGDIISADAVVADITGHNPNVFYELAIAHAWKKPCILLSGDGERVPFDIVTQNVIALRMDSFGAFEATKALVAKHFADIADGKAGLENPVAKFERGRELEKSADPLAAEIAELRDEVAGLRAENKVGQRSPSAAELLGFIEPPMDEKQRRSVRDLFRPRQAELGLPDSSGQIFDESRGWAKPADDGL